MDTRTSLLGAAGLFAFAGLTDLLDGYVARRWRLVSSLGSFLDPLADKCAIDGCIAALLLRSAFPLPLAMIFIGRDLAVTGIRVSAKGRSDRLTPGRLAKVKTFALNVGILGILISRGAGIPVRGDSMLFIMLAALLSLVSGANYVTRLGLSPSRSASILGYLLFPRPGPLLSGGKIAFFLIGSFIAVSAGIPAVTVRTWLLVFAIYELVISQGKYVINDFAGRASDRHFLRGTRNRCPSRGRGAWLLAAYAAARAGAGIIALLVVAGWVVAAVGGLTVLLQIVYELLKISDIPRRGDWLFVVVSANYGLRSLAGVGAVNHAAPLSPTGFLTLLWASGLGALFLAFYWRQQGEYYLEQRHTAPGLLTRYKPGVLSVYQRDSLARSLGRPLLHERLLQAMAAGGILFAAFAPGGSIALRSTAVLLYLPWASLGLVGMRAAGSGSGRRLALISGPALVSGLITAALGLQLRTACLLPIVLGSIAFLTYLLLMSSVARKLVLHGLHEPHPTAA